MTTPSIIVKISSKYPENIDIGSSVGVIVLWCCLQIKIVQQLSSYFVSTR